MEKVINYAMLIALIIIGPIFLHNIFVSEGDSNHLASGKVAVIVAAILFVIFLIIWIGYKKNVARIKRELGHRSKNEEESDGIPHFLKRK